MCSGLEFLVKWRGYDDATWEPELNLENCRDLIEEYKRCHVRGLPLALVIVPCTGGGAYI